MIPMIGVTAIQRLCLHDGPGVRTTVFLKGCLLDCPWCCNPETKNATPDCYTDGQAIVRRLSSDQLFEKIIADLDYFGTDGGVTFSGGEPLLQAQRLLPLLRKLKDHGVSICFETALYAPTACIELINSWVDHYIVDFKVIGSPFLKHNCHLDIDFEQNLSYLSRKVYKVRMVLIRGITDTVENVNELTKIVAQYNLPDPEFLQYHLLGTKKAERLGLIPSAFEEVSPERKEEIMRCFRNARYSEI